MHMFNYPWCFTYEYIRNEQHIRSGKALLNSTWQPGHTGLLFQFWWATKCRKWSRAHATKGLHSECSCTNRGEAICQLWHTVRHIPSYKSHVKGQKKLPGVALLFLLTTSCFSPAHTLIISYRLWACYSKNLFHPPPVSWQHVRECQNPVLGFILLYKH